MVTVFSMLDRKLLRDLRRIWGQAVAIGVIVGCGVAMLILSLGTLNSLQESLLRYYDRARFADVFAAAKRAPETLADTIARIEGVRRVETRVSAYVTLDIAGVAEPSMALLVSLPERGEALLNTPILERGRSPEPDRPNEVVVTPQFLAAHGFMLGDRLQATLNGRKREMTIVGTARSPEFIYTIGPGALMPDDRRFGVMWMGRKALEAAYDLDGAFNDVTATLMRGASAERVVDELDRVLGPYGGAGAYAREDQLSHAYLDGEMQQLRMTARIIPPVFLIVAAFLLNVIMTRLVDTEREQIGLLKAFGYSNTEVARHYLKLAMAVTALGVLFGFALGTVLADYMTRLYGELFRFPALVFRPSFSAYAIGAAAAAFAAMVGTWSAVRKAASMPPAEAMRPAPPASYRRGLFDASGVTARFDEPTRMILRHMFRWPGRSAATVAGVAASASLVIGTLFSFDSIDLMADMFFVRGAPYDVGVNFVEPASVRSLQEMRRLPGVIAAEPHRGLAVRFTHGPRTERGSIQGFDPDARLKRVFDTNLREIDIPEEGLTLSKHMAETLEVRVGDRVRVEVLEGRRPTVEIPVTAIVEEYIAAPAYMGRRAINRLMREGRLISGVYLEIDETQTDAFYEAIKERPATALVMLQSVARDMFYATLAETIGIIMNIYRGIGAAIAAGVVYNAARIALAERARELASMRVLGFSKSEVSYVLLGELALLTLIALPLGCVAGYGLAWLISTTMATDLYRIPLTIHAATYGGAVVTVLLAAAASAWLVSRRINNLDLIAVLKTRD